MGPDVPETMVDGDPVYEDGFRVGTFHGDRNRPGGWYVELRPTREMPSELAEKYRRRYAEGE